eukprot:TRINITY_DN4793_c0_g1_i3.p1 TRINITY_DN4793_c0_g1~~TRINITY_DN4793_c0_g1_i3.p1  ORF type:complete len:312 (+),score=64.85 TRINITY_DN4793_c0_g1_i3:9-944(+)
MLICVLCIFFFKQKTAYEMLRSLVGSEMCIRDRYMGFMKGGELFYHLQKERRFSEDRARFYAAEILLALEYLHSKDLVYRDMKPENILMDEEGHVHLSDYGMAKHLKTNQVAMSFVGTADYLSPEVIAGVGHGQPTDWWGLGILIFEMLYGKPPFYSSNQNMAFELIQRGPLRFPNIKNLNISEKVKDLMTKLLEKNPQFRLGSVQDAKEIKVHPWFKDIDWVKLENKEIVPAFKPVIQSEFCQENFNPYLNKIDPKEYQSTGQNNNTNQISKYEEEFVDFTYVPNNKNLFEGHELPEEEQQGLIKQANKM